MVFSSTTFLFLFLPLVLLGHVLLRSIRLRNLFLLLASLFFYAWGEGFGLCLMLLCVGVNYWAGIRVEKAKNPGKARSWLVAALGINLGMLVWYKYPNFLINNLNYLLLTLDLPTIYLAPVHLPVGISFFIFQALSYVVDVYRGETPAQRNILRVALYISLFPQLIAGPIVRYVDVREQMIARTTTLSDFSIGIQRFIVGLAKKVLLADTLGYVADQLFGVPATALTADAAWLGALCYAFQIYFDFSGYSDMAIGLGRMLGFHFLENFNFPYIAQSIQDFWRRWHISLSTWFRDYLYIPLGGSRIDLRRTYVNLLIVFFLCGLWHGASWDFVVWGLFHGSFLVLERMGLGVVLKKIPLVFRHAYVLLVVMVGWVFFRAEGLGNALDYLGAMIGINKNPGYYAGLYLNGEIIFTLALAAIFSTPLYFYLGKKTTQITDRLRGVPVLIHRLALLGLFVLSVLTLINSTYNPFIYYRF